MPQMMRSVLSREGNSAAPWAWNSGREPVLIQAIGAVLPAALAVALSPFPLIGIVLILAGRHGRRNGLLFTAGWIAGLGIVATLVVVVLGGADDPESPSSAIADWGRVLAGVALIVLGGAQMVAASACRQRGRDATLDGVTR
ncbi:GAP family protein [Streptomyces sp. LN785]|uniref:GAP family protein n=1 Tax=Streptomyces sp. LN785 TaxID=3112983 RepID=UPI0037104F21